MKSARDELDIINAYREVGTYRGAAEMCGTTHKAVKRVIEKDGAGGQRPARPANYAQVRDLVAVKIERTRGQITAKRLLPEAVAAGYGGRRVTSAGW